MKHWLVDYSVKSAEGITEKRLTVEAASIDDALAKAHKAVATNELPNIKPGDRIMIWGVCIIEDDVFDSVH